MYVYIYICVCNTYNGEQGYYIDIDIYMLNFDYDMRLCGSVSLPEGRVCYGISISHCFQFNATLTSSCFPRKGNFHYHSPF